MRICPRVMKVSRYFKFQKLINLNDLLVYRPGTKYNYYNVVAH